MKTRSILLAAAVALGSLVLPVSQAGAHDKGGRYYHPNYGQYKKYGYSRYYRPAPYQRVYYPNGYYYTRPYGYYTRPAGGVQLNISLGR